MEFPDFFSLIYPIYMILGSADAQYIWMYVKLLPLNKGSAIKIWLVFVPLA